MMTATLLTSKTPPANDCPEYDTDPNPNKAPVQEFWGCGVPLYCHYSQVHSVRVPYISQIELFNFLLGIIITIKYNYLH